MSEKGMSSSASSRTAVADEVRTRLRSVILLAGSVRQDRFTRSLGRSVLSLPVDSTRSLLDLWVARADRLRESLSRDELALRIVVDQSSPLPRPTARPGIVIQLERDPYELRGTAGVLADICGGGQNGAEGYHPEDYVLVANAAQVLWHPLPEMLEELLRVPASVSILSCRKGTPSSVMLIRCGALAAVPRVGFYDLKEQALPKIASRDLVRVVSADGPYSPPLRTFSNYLRFLREWHLVAAGEALHSRSPFDEDWQPVFSVVEEGAEVDPSARVLDSVVLAGGRVGPGAVVLRSLIGPQGVVSKGKVVIAEYVGNSKNRGRSAR